MLAKIITCQDHQRNLQSDILNLVNKQKGLAPILIVILIALVVGGYFIYQKQLKPVVQPTTPAVSPNKESTNSAEIVNWRTYTDMQFNYSIKYPSTADIINYPTKASETPDLLGALLIDVYAGDTEVQAPGMYVIRIWSNLGIKIVDEKTRDEWCSQLTQKELKNSQLSCGANLNLFKATETNGLKAFRSAATDNRMESYYIPNGDYVYEIRFDNIKFIKEKTVNDSVPSQILSTFKFTQ